MPADAGTARDKLRLHGALAGVAGSYGVDVAQRFPLLLRLGAGAFIGSARDIRDGSFQTRAGTSVTVPETSNDPSAVFVYVDPEVTFGVHLGDHFDLSAGVQALFLIAAKKPKWGDDGNPAVTLGGDGFATYPADPLVGGLIVVFAPGLDLRYTF